MGQTNSFAENGRQLQGRQGGNADECPFARTASFDPRNSNRGPQHNRLLLNSLDAE